MSRFTILATAAVAPFLLNAQGSDCTMESASVKAGRAPRRRQDDHQTDPAGQAGDRIACGVIRRI